MEAPDRIYLAFDNEFVAQASTVKEDANKNSVFLPEYTPIEYIRKDALLEWLKKEYETMAWYYEKMKHVTGSVGDNSSSGKAEAYGKMIEKVKSL